MFGQLVVAHRRRLGLTQDELAATTGLSVRSIRRIESGRIQAPRQVTVRLLADAFGLDGDDRERFACGAHGGGPPVAARDAPLPAQLPADLPGFTGRTAPLAELDALLADPARSPTAVVISAIVGTAGVGKTALAVHWAHQIRGRFPDGQLYVDLRGFDPVGQASPATVLRRFLDGLGVPAARCPADFDAQVGLYRSMLAGKRLLVLLDNARDAEQVRPLLPASPTSLAIVTSRNRLTGLAATEGARCLTLDLLSAAEARDLLAHRLGAARVAAEPGAVERIITATARLPLALAVAAARAGQSGFPLEATAAELDHAGRRLDALDTGDPASQLRTVFSWSYHALSPEAARLFRLLGLPHSTEISETAAAGLADRPVPEVRRLLTELTTAHLVEVRPGGRYTFHDLLRAYATDLVHRIDPAEERHAAVTRLLDHYTHAAHAANRLLAPHREPIPVPLAQPVSGSATVEFADHRQAFAWLAAEYPALDAALRQADEDGRDAYTWQLAWSLNTYLNRQGRWPEQVAVWQIALRTAERLGDRAVQAYSHRAIANACTLLDRHDNAHAHLRHALGLDLAAGDRLGQAFTHQNLSIVYERQGDERQALDHAQCALRLYRATGRRHGEATMLNAVGWYHSRLGDHERALSHCREALPVLQELGDRLAEANTWDSLGHAHHNLGHHRRAADCYGRAVTMFRELGDRYNEAVTLANLADTHHANGNPEAAAVGWRAALDILTDLNSPHAARIRAKLRRLTD